eukprot:TRINITY_DN12997_c0_g1_i1.p1 TRINITY_DN12997_c0_g1~~TRINITY_DN12997_c0_g1_i1.p1  ORF type:complete len:139 (-),score=38.40 TRINITY_DN12997_c0_g1_i1:183-599(-)
MKKGTSFQNVFTSLLLMCCLKISLSFPTEDIFSGPRQMFDYLEPEYDQNSDLSSYQQTGTEDLNKQKRSFASFRFRPKSLESLIMINRAYDMMNNINSIVNEGEEAEEYKDAEMEAKARARAHALMANRNKDDLESDN